MTLINNRIRSFRVSMKKVDVCFVRHGETIANRDGMIQGHCDFPLTEKGHAHAQRVGRALRNIKWHKVYSSDLTRAVHVRIINILPLCLTLFADN